MENSSTSTEGAPGDWVKELFAPIYNFDDVVAAGKKGYEVKESIIKRVPILDPLTVKDVFDRVHQRIVEAELAKQREKEEKEESRKIERIDPRKSCIWDTDELETLRQVYKSAKGEIRKLEVALREKQAHNQSLENTVSRQRKEIEQLQAKLMEATKSNQRLVIHRDSLQKDMAVLEVKQSALTQMWHDIEADKKSAMDETKAAHVQLDTERLNRQKLESELQEAKQDLIREATLLERNLKSKYESEISDLQEVVRDLTVELRKERQLHEASKKGLEHLRRHFSSLPLQNVLPQNIVDKDEVGFIDHVGL